MSETLDTLLVLTPALPLLAAVAIGALALLGSESLRRRAHWLAIAAVAGSLVCSLFILGQVAAGNSATQESSIGFEHTVDLWTWAEVDAAQQLSAEETGGGERVFDFEIAVTLRADSLTAIMLSMVTLISLLVVIYSVGYMRDDPGYARFFAYVSLFVFSMIMLVSVSNFVLLYVFWEAVGACSYLLIGFWYRKPEATAAGKKAFLVNRVGDFGFALAIFLIWTTYGTLNFHDPAEPATAAVTAAATGDDANAAAQSPADSPPGVLGQERLASGAYVGGGIAALICLLLLVGACGKSAQFPLHVWLPDAMEGPTPVSALIHAATMVTAGVYMVVRCAPLFAASPEAQLTVAVVGGVTALLAALIALTQFDLKRVLAYSTISQLGYMFLALGAGTWAGNNAGMFHLFTHAFFKALLFLGAGSVMHAMGGVIDMRRFGGLRRLMPKTHLTFLMGALALAGVFPLAGFWSKDAVVSSVRDKADDLHHEHLRRDGAAAVHADDHGHGPSPAVAAANAELLTGLSDEQLASYGGIYRTLYWLALVTALLTAFYTFRAFYLTFYGPKEIPSEAGHHAHESPPVMWVPLLVLALGAIFVGTLLEPTHLFSDFLRHAPSLAYERVAATRPAGVFHGDVAALSTLAALLGIGLASYLYLGDDKEINWLRRALRFEWLKGLASPGWVNRLSRLSWVEAIDRGARRIGLGAVARLLGYLALLVLSVLMLPLLVGYYVSPYRISQDKFYFDELYQYVIVTPARALAAFCAWIDRYLIDGLVDLCGVIPRGVGALMRSLQMGLVQFYALAMVLGVLILVVVQLLVAR